MSREDIRRMVSAAPEVKLEPPRPLMRELPPADPFPVDALGDVLTSAAMGIHERVRAPIAICGQSVLAAATLATQGHADIKLPTGQAKPVSNYFISVALTGERKSAADREALWPIRKREASLRETYDAEYLKFVNAKTRGTQHARKQSATAKAIAHELRTHSTSSAPHRFRLWCPS